MDAKTPTSRRLLTADEAAYLLSITRRNLLRLSRRGLIPRVKVGGAVRFDPRALADYIDRQAGNLDARKEAPRA